MSEVRNPLLSGDPVSKADLLKQLGGASVATVLGIILWYLLTVTIPSIQKDSAENRKTFEQAIQRTSERDAKIVDAILDIKRDK